MKFRTPVPTNSGALNRPGANADSTIETPVAGAGGLMAQGHVPLLDEVLAVPTANRPTKELSPGMMIFDTTLGKPIWRSLAGGWVDATGSVV
ncbi:hypothetical protein [Anaeromyxobacter paludicola]|nr:hypothetical protein [Anaeromyxobacter paludicola]